MLLTLYSTTTIDMGIELYTLILFEFHENVYLYTHYIPIKYQHTYLSYNTNYVPAYYT